MRNQDFSTAKKDQELLAKTHVTLTPGGAGIQAHAGGVCVASAAADVDCGAGAADCVREYCESAAGAGDGAAGGDVGAHGAGGDAWEDRSAAADGEPGACGDWRTGGLVVAFVGTQMLLMLAFPGDENVPIRCEPFAGGDRVCVCAVGGDGDSVWGGAGVDCGECESCGCFAQRDADDGVGGFTAAARAGGAAGGVVAGAAGGCGIVFAESEQAAEQGPEAGCEEPVHRAYQSAGGGLRDDTGGGALPDDRGAVPPDTGSDEGWDCDVYADGGQ